MAEYTYKQWGDEKTEENNIHADDCYRWQAGIEAAGGTWDGEWVDLDKTGKGLITADQLNALEQEIADLYGSGFTAKTFEDSNIPGTAEWNRIEDAINTILNRTAFAIYCETDNSLTFYVDTEVPSVGDTYDGKVVAEVYTGLENTNFSSNGSSYWYAYVPTLSAFIIDKSFSLCKPVSFERWFAYSNDLAATFTGLEYIDTSKATTLSRMFNRCVNLTDADLKTIVTWNISSATNLSYMFYGCSGLTILEPISGWDISSVTNLSYMFYGCSGLTSVDEITTKWDFSNVTNIAQMFAYCDQLTTADVSKMDTAKVINISYLLVGDSALTTIYSDDDVFVTTAVTNSTGMFNGCRALVGGNGTTFDSSKTDASMAHIDTEDNPGYFTAKG